MRKQLPPKIIPLYLPHKGCPHQCVYCNQPLVTGDEDHRSNWRRMLESIPQHTDQNWEIAFYGGTFSGLSQEKMYECFALVKPYIKSVKNCAIRISTRPDYVSDATLEFLWTNGVRTIELGAESFNDHVLQRSGRGHSADNIRDACARIAARGFTLGLHLMCGLPAQSEISFYETVEETVRLNPDLVRISPTLVLHGTPLAKMFHRNDYQPMTIENAITQCCHAYKIFHQNNIIMARIGLALSDQDGDGANKVIAGPWHPALRHEVESSLAREAITTIIKDKNETRITINPKDISIVYGAGKSNLQYWTTHLNREIKIERDRNQPRHSFSLSSGERFSLFNIPENIT